jgi:hypothetical protein
VKRLGWVVSALLVVGLAAIAFLTGRASAPKEEPSHVGMRATPGVITAIHDVARLEATVFHVEKVVEVDDAQSRLWGLVRAKDALLLVAVGDVIAGVDMTKVNATDVHEDGPARSVRVLMPAPEIVSSTLDEHATHVYRRSTDVLAARNEQLEGTARLAAEQQMRKEAIDGGILERARTSADRTISALLRQLGYEHIEIDWADRT